MFGSFEKGVFTIHISVTVFKVNSHCKKVGEHPKEIVNYLSETWKQGLLEARFTVLRTLEERFF